MIALYGVRLVSMKATAWTVFFDDDSDEMPQEFDTYDEAKAYADERVACGYANAYTIEEY